VVRTDALASPAEVVKHEVGRDRADVELVADAVRVADSAAVAEAAVAVTRAGTAPLPAAEER
jgi:hypothetical protein